MRYTAKLLGGHQGGSINCAIIAGGRLWTGGDDWCVVVREAKPVLWQCLTCNKVNKRASKRCQACGMRPKEKERPNTSEDDSSKHAMFI